MKQILKKLNIETSDAMTSLLQAILAAAVLIAVIVAIRKSFARLAKRADSRGDASAYLRVIGNILTVLVLIIGLFAIFSGVPTLRNLFSTVLASSGVAAVVLSLAAQDAIGNLIGGMMISISKPFKTGDMIRFIDKDTTGTVIKITLRHTIIKTLENKYVIVPNGTINSSVIENISFNGDIRIFIEVGITYESDTERAMELLAQSVTEQQDFKDVRTDDEKQSGVPPVPVIVSELGDSAIIIKAAVWVKDMLAGYHMKSRVLLTMKNKIAGENVSFAYPHIVVVKD